MTSRRPPSCHSCSQSCKSILALQRAKGNKAFDQLRLQCTFRRGQNIPFNREGRTGFYCIQSGYLRLNYHSQKTYRAVRISGPGHIVGLVNSVSSAYTASALEPVVACFFDIEVFSMLQAKSPEMSQDVIKWLCSLIVVRDDRIATLGSRSAKAKVAATLVSLAKKFGRTSSDGSVEIIPAIDRRTLAELSGTVIETFSRVITELETSKILLRNRRAIKILNFAALQECMDE